MSLYKQFKTDESLEKEGVWIEYGETDKGDPIRIKIARAGGQNKAFAKVLERRTRPHRRALQNGTMDPQLAEDIFRETFAETVVLDWENVDGPDGELMEFNKDNILQVFRDLPDLYADLKQQASSAAIFREEIRQEDLGN